MTSSSVRVASRPRMTIVEIYNSCPIFPWQRRSNFTVHKYCAGVAVYDYTVLYANVRARNWNAELSMERRTC